VDLVKWRSIRFSGEKGDDITYGDVPAELVDKAMEKRKELIEYISEVDEEIAEKFLMEEDPSPEELGAAIRRATVALKFVPLFLGSAFKNKGVQALLDGVVDYLPNPLEVTNVALDLNKNEAPVVLTGNPAGPFVGLAFKLEEGRFGQLTYIRVYDGTIRKGDVILNTTTQKKVKVPRLVRMHSDDMEDVTEASAGDIVALFGVDCASGDTFTNGKVNFAMTSMKVPDPVMSLAVTPKSRDSTTQFSKALNRFQREDPTFRVALDKESGETIISGMGELHLEIYVERMNREYKVECDTGKPQVNFRETITSRATFDYLHKKQSGGSGQYGRVAGYIEPMDDEEIAEAGGDFVFENGIVGNIIPPGFITAIEKGFKEAVNSGALIGHPVQKVRVVLNDGAAHAVDSNEMAFKLAAMGAFRQAYANAGPTILEPVMMVDITAPGEFQGTIVGDVNKRKGMILNSETAADEVSVQCEVPLNNMFGYSTGLRSMTQGKGEFTMEYLRHASVAQDVQKELINEFGKSRGKSS